MSLSDDQLKEISEALDELRDDVVQADLPSKPKSMILEQLDQVRRAIRNYRIWGAKGLVVAVERAAGAAILNVDLFSEKYQDPTVQAFFAFLSKVHSMAKVVGGAKLLAEGFLKLIGSGS